MQTVGRVLAATDRANGYSYIQAALNSNEAHNSTKNVLKKEKNAEQSQLRDYYYQFASDQLESSVMMALEIQEKYGSS